MLDKKLTHSIYLIKPDFIAGNKYLRDTTGCDHYSIRISGHPSANLYVKTVPSKLPSWSTLLPKETTNINWSKYQTRSFFGLLLMEVDNHQFALTSGQGRHLLNPFAIENGFGFRTVLNSVDPKTIQQLSKTTLSDNPKRSIEQVSKAVSLNQFTIDAFTDLLQKIRGKSKIDQLGVSLDGEDALKISVGYELAGLPKLLRECLRYYNSNAYKRFFPDIDNLVEVKDKEQKILLDKELESQLNAELALASADHDLSGDVWASIPEFVFDDDFDCFTYKNSIDALRYYDIELKDIFREHYLKRDRAIKRRVTIVSLARHDIFIRKADGAIYPKWAALNCVNAVVAQGRDRYFFLEGRWFRASKRYVDSLDEKIARIDSSNLVFNNWPQQVKEKEYLESRPLTSHANYLVLDRDNIRIKGHAPVEPCDIYTQDKLLVHVKRYGSSALLGHLFNQGYGSGDLLVNSIEFREKFNEKLEDNYKIRKFDPTEFTIAYVIGTNYPDDQKLPLLAKIILIKAHDSLRSKGFKVTLDFCRRTPN